MKKFFKYNTGAAIGALVLIVLLSIFAGVNRTVYSYKNKAEKALPEYPTYDMSDAADLNKYVEFAVKLSAVAKSNGCDTGSLDSYIAALDTNSPFIENGDAISGITSSSAAVYNELVSKTNVDGQQLRSAKSYYYEMDSCLMRLRNTGNYSAALEEYNEAVENYNKYAEKYNKAKNSFPANILTWNLPDAAVFDR